MWISGRVRWDGFHSLDGVVLELHERFVELRVLGHHVAVEMVRGADGGHVVGEEASGEEELAEAGGADGAVESGTFVVGDVLVRE